MGLCPERRCQIKAVKRVLFSMLIMAVGAGCCSIRPTPLVVTKSENDKLVEIVEGINDSTVALVMGPTGEKLPYCAGVWLDKQYILTAGHCVHSIAREHDSETEDESEDSVGTIVSFINHGDLVDGEIPDETFSSAVVKKLDKRLDLALLENIGVTSKHSFVNISRKDARVGENTHIVGHPVGIFWTYTRGVVASVRKMYGPEIVPNAEKVKIIQMSAPVWAGNSGGGAFSSDGELIGICSFITLKAPNIGFFIHKDEIKDFIAPFK